jgi:hypothetical protein
MLAGLNVVGSLWLFVDFALERLVWRAGGERTWAGGWMGRFATGAQARSGRYPPPSWMALTISKITDAMR